MLLLLNLFVIDFFIDNQRRLRGEISSKTRRMQELSKLLSEKDLWEQRDAALQAQQPRVVNERVASNDLLKYVKEVSDKHQAIISDQQLGDAKRRAQYTSVDVKQVVLKSSWKGLLLFLMELQRPDQFIVFENANIEVDPEDKTKFKGTFRVARWYAL